MALTRRAKKRIGLLAGLFVAFSLLAGGLYFFRQAQRARVTEAAYERGLAAYEAGEYGEAVRHLGRYVNRNRTDGETILKWVDARRRVPELNNRHLTQSVQWARIAAETMPNDPRPLEQLLQLHRELGYLAEYLTTAERLLEIEPSHEEALLARVAAYNARGEVDHAADAAQAFVDAHPDDWRGYAAIASLMRQRGASSEEILAYLDEAAERMPEDPNLAVEQALAARRISTERLIEEERTEAREVAREHARHAASLPPGDADTLARIVQVLDVLDLQGEADQLLRREAERLGADATVVAIERLWKNGRVQEALDTARSAIDGSVADADTNLLGWVALLSDLREPSEDVRAAMSELESRPTQDAVFWQSVIGGMRSAEADQWHEARDRLRAAAAIRPESGAPEFLMGQIDLRVGDRRAAASRWRNAIQREPSWIAARLALASLLLQDGDLREAHRQAIAALRIAPERAASGVVFARTTAALAESGDRNLDSIPLAINAMEAIAGSELPQKAEATALLVRLYAASGRLGDAQRTLDAMLEAGEPIPPNDLLALSRIAGRRGLRNADRLLEQAASASDDPNILLARAMQSAQEGRTDEGASMLREAISRAPEGNKPGLERALARYLDSTNDPTGLDAFRAMFEAREDDPGTLRELLESSVAWRDERLVTRAIAAYRTATGNEAAGWRVFEARRMLTFEAARAESPNEAEKAAAAVVQLLEPVFRMDFGNVRAAELLSEAYLLLGERDDAINRLSTALGEAPNEVTLYPRLIALLQEEGESTAAEQRLRQFMQLQNLSPAFRRVRADLLMNQGMWTLAMPELEQLAASGEERDLLRLAAGYARRGRTADARRVYENIIAVDSASAEARIAAADFFASTGDHSTARRMIDSLPESEPLAVRLRAKADFIERYEDASEAEPVFRELVREAPTASSHTALVRYLVRQGRLEDAHAALQEAVRAFPADPAIRSLDRAVALTQGRAPETGATTSVSSEDPEARVLSAIERMQREPERLDLFASDIASIVEEHPRYLPAWRLAVMTEIRRGDDRRAIDMARNAARALPTEPEAARLVVDALLATAAREREQDRMEAARRATEDALVAAREWRERALSSPFEVDVTVAQLQDQLGDPREALRTLEPHREKVVAESSLLPFFAGLLAKTGREDLADSLLYERAKREPALTLSYIDTALTIPNAPDATRRWLTRAAELLEGQPQGAVPLAQAWFDLGLRTGASEDMERAIGLLEPLAQDPSNAPVVVLLGTALEQTGRLDEAESAYRRAIDALPNHPIALNNLAYLLARQGASPAEAVDLADRAVRAGEGQMSPRQRANLIDTQVLALLRAGEVERAEEAARAGLELAPGDLALQIGLAEALAMRGACAQARQTLAAATTARGFASLPESTRQRAQSAQRRVDACEPAPTEQ